MNQRPIQLGVIGGAVVSKQAERLAFETGREIARRGCVLLCGGHGGVMEAAAQGARSTGGRTVGILPGRDAASANPWIHIPLSTGMGEARNALVVGAAEAVVSVGGAWGRSRSSLSHPRWGSPSGRWASRPPRGWGSRRWTVPLKRQRGQSTGRGTFVARDETLAATLEALGP